MKMAEKEIERIGRLKKEAWMRKHHASHLIVCLLILAILPAVSAMKNTEYE